MTGIDVLVRPDRLGPALAAALGDDRWTAFEAELVAGGKSNLTFELACPAGALILRRPPEGDLLPSAHDMGREVRIQRALATTGVPVPEIVLFEPSPEPLGVPFYVMRKVLGRVIRDALPPGYAQTAADRHRIADALVDTLAELHGVALEAVGLADFGRPQGFLARQLRRWQAQSEASRVRETPSLDALGLALRQALPESPASTVVHGDFRLDNCLLDPADPGRVAAVLDWELSTLGDPLTDLGMLLFYWPEPGEPPTPLVPGVTASDGFPPRSYLLGRYARRTGRDVSAVPYYEAFARFKFAVIIQGVAARSAAGSMGGQDFGRVDEDVVRLAESGLAILKEA